MSRIWLVVAVVLAGLAGFWVIRSAVHSEIESATSGTARPDTLPPGSSVNVRDVPSSARTASAVPANPPLLPADPEALSRLPDPDSPLPATQAAMAEETGDMAERLAASFSSNPDAWEVLARCEKWLGNTAAAVSRWDRCLELDPKYGYALYGKATVAADKGDYADAADLFRKALDARPGWPEAQLELARALVNAGRARESIAVLEEHVGHEPILPESYILLGQARLESGDLEGAKSAYQAAVKLLPDYAGAYYGLATVSARLGQRDDARKAMEQFQKCRAVEFQTRKKGKVEYDDLDVMRLDAAPLYLAAGQIFFTHKRLAEAERLWRRAAELDPHYVECRQALAWLYRSTGRLPQAVEMLEQLAAIVPDNRVYLEETARLYAELQQPDKAEEVRRRLAQSKVE